MNKLKTRTLLITSAIMLTACASPPKYDYVKEGASQNQKVDAMSECQYQIRLNKSPADQQAELLRLCMQGKGFRLKRIN